MDDIVLWIVIITLQFSKPTLVHLCWTEESSSGGVHLEGQGLMN